VRFEEGDEIVLFTDGVTEAHQDSENLFGERRLMDFISPRRSADRRNLSAGIIEALKDFTGNQFKDDIFVVHIRIKHPKATLAPAPAFSNN
jgi:sigma-B regulation protein RsbU (phosphoserine phosphatase)